MDHAPARVERNLAGRDLLVVGFEKVAPEQLEQQLAWIDFRPGLDRLIAAGDPDRDTELLVIDASTLTAARPLSPAEELLEVVRHWAHPSVEPWQERVIEEKRELDAKIKRLRGFAGTPAWARMDERDRSLMVRQLEHMVGYSETLAARIERFGKEAA